MKILELAQYVFIEKHPSATRKQTGLAYMVRSICDMLSEENDVHVLTQSVISNKMQVGKWLMLKRTYTTILLHFKWRYLIQSIKNYRKYKDLGLMRIFLYWLSAGQVEDYIKQWHPDIIHVHSIGPGLLPFYYAAARQNIPVVSTLHGLISFNSLYPKSEAEMNIERAFIKMCVNNGYSMTFISSGMKKMVSELCGNDCTNITVILNCYRPTSLDTQYNSLKIDGELHLACIGTLTPWKNQIQVIRILPILQKNLKNIGKIVLDLYGDGEMREDWQHFCEDNHIENVRFHGRVSQNEIFVALNNADLLVFPSIEEGFGIPIIEAYSCGTPVVSYPDLDASEDLASDDCIIFTKDRTDEALIKAITEALLRDWDKKKICEFSRQFTMDAISIKYNDIVKKKHKVWTLESIKSVIDSY